MDYKIEQIIKIQKVVRGFLIRQKKLLNLDYQFLKMREDMYANYRKQVFIDMAQKHFLQKCKCEINGKICNCNGKIKLSEFGNKDYIEKIYDDGIFDAIYNITQSVTQSLKTRAGKDFEKCFQSLLKNLNINYAYQVFIDNNGIIHPFTNKLGGKNKGHSVDFMIPPPIFGKHIKKFKGDIISTKTTIRERFNQDKYLCGNKCRIIVISLEKIQNKHEIISIQVSVENKELTKYLLSRVV